MMATMATGELVSPEAPYARRHLRLGWLSLGVFAAFGLVLETLHGFKLAAYVDVSHETRRLMWTLAHAHGVLLGLIHVVFALCLQLIPGLAAKHLRLVSLSLVSATLLLPGGFFLGGLVFYGGDPGLGILLVPVGAALLIFALGIVAGSTTNVWVTDEVGRPPGRRR
jgi:hypothetical protein